MVGRMSGVWTQRVSVAQPLRQEERGQVGCVSALMGGGGGFAGYAPTLTLPLLTWAIW
jgi:hypothetical protein